MSRFRVGQRVQILRTDILLLRPRFKKGPVYGWIRRIDGEYHYVRPAWCSWEIELYPSEIRSTKRKK